MENNNFADFPLHRDLESRQRYSPAENKIRVRCPQCFKLFSVKVHGIVENRPRFECSSCTTQFWVPFPECLEQEELLGFPVSWLDTTPEEVSTHLKSKPAAAVSEENLEPCPKCGTQNNRSQTECSGCGVLFHQVKEQKEDLEAGFKVSRRLRECWKTLIEEFDQPERHEEFLQLCQKENAMEYAIYRYGRVHKACPSDEISKAMLERLEKKVSVPLAVEQESKPKESPKAKRERLRISSFVIAFGVLLMLVGYLLPTFRNIVGLGAATVFLAIAFRVYFHKN